jgi:hypothetical protein
MNPWYRFGWLASAAMLALSSPARAQEDDDTSTDNLGDQKGSDRVDAAAAPVDDSRTNAFEKERFFIDKVDTAATEDKTLFQGNLTSSTFLYNESGGTAAGGNGAGGTGASSQFSRIFTDLRFQLDARHIRGGRWQARVDVRGRGTMDPDESTATGYGGTANTRVQSGLTGESEAEVRELWLARPGDRYDLFLGRQFISDLGAVKIDGLRIDYAKSERITLLGFAGAYPVRGSRSIETDYPVLQRANGTELGKAPPIAAGAGAAYRTRLSYGSLGAVTIAPLKGGNPRVYVTSTGYLRTGPKLDVYHFGLIDLVGDSGFALTNLSGGINFRPTPALRVTASINHVDTETLTIQAQTFLLDPSNDTVIRNETEVRRISSTQAQAGVSAALGRTQQLEISLAVNARNRPEVKVANGSAADASVYTFQASTSVDVFAQIVHRNLWRSRLGADVVRAFSNGNASSRSSFLTVRGFLSREFRQGRGSWEGEVSYSTSKDDGVGATAAPIPLPPAPPPAMLLFGKSKTSTLAAAGTVYFRVRPALFVMGSLGVSRFGLTSTQRAGMTLTDPSVLSLTGFVRAAYRF